MGRTIDGLIYATSEVNSPPSYQINIYSVAIINALQRVVKYYPGQDLTGVVSIAWPYPILVYHYDELTSFRDEISLKSENDLCIREKDAYEDLGLLLEFLDDQVMAGVNAEKEMNRKGYFTYEYAWVGWKPGRTLLARVSTEHEFRPQVIYSVTGGIFNSP